VLNSGHTRPTAYVIRLQGTPPVPTRFSTWASIAFATIGRLKGTLMDRSVVIRLRRRRRDERVQRRGGRDHRNPRPASIGTGGRLRRNTHLVTTGSENWRNCLRTLMRSDSWCLGCAQHTGSDACIAPPSPCTSAFPFLSGSLCAIALPRR
jgi:hypothetical protein